MVGFLSSITTAAPSGHLLARLTAFRPQLAHGVAAILLVGSVFGYNFYNQSVGGLPVTLDRLLMGALVLWACTLVLNGKLPFPSIRAADFFLLFFIAVLAVNLILSDWRFRQNKPVAYFLFFYVMPMMSYAVIRLIGHQQQTLRILKWSLIGLASYLAFTAICETRDWTALIFPRYISDPNLTEFLGRGRGPFLNPIGCGLYQIAGLTCALPVWPAAKGKQRFWLCLLYGLLVAGIGATLTRSVWLAAVPVIAVFVWQNSSWQFRGLCTLGAPIFLIILVLGFGEKFNSFKRDKHVSVEDMSDSVNLRPLLATVAQKMIADHPLLGVGLGQYPKYSNPYHFRDVNDVPLQKVIGYVQHNTFLAYAVEIGLLGLASYSALLLLNLWMSGWLWLDTRLPLEVRYAGFVSLGIMWTFLFNSMFHDMSIISMANMLLFSILGLNAALFAHFYPNNSPQNSLPSVPSPGPRPTTLTTSATAGTS